MKQPQRRADESVCTPRASAATSMRPLLLLLVLLVATSAFVPAPCAADPSTPVSTPASASTTHSDNSIRNDSEQQLPPSSPSSPLPPPSSSSSASSPAVAAWLVPCVMVVVLGVAAGFVWWCFGYNIPSNVIHVKVVTVDDTTTAATTTTKGSSVESGNGSDPTAGPDTVQAPTTSSTAAAAVNSFRRDAVVGARSSRRNVSRNKPSIFGRAHSKWFGSTNSNHDSNADTATSTTRTSIRATDFAKPRTATKVRFALRTKGMRKHEPGKAIHLERGHTYEFHLDGVPQQYPFHISLSAHGGVPQNGGTSADAAWVRGVTGAPGVGRDVIIFHVPFDAPSTLYYQCTNFPHMGGEVRVEEPPAFDFVEEDEAGWIDDDGDDLIQFSSGGGSSSKSRRFKRPLSSTNSNGNRNSGSHRRYHQHPRPLSSTSMRSAAAAAAAWNRRSLHRGGGLSSISPLEILLAAARTPAEEVHNWRASLPVWHHHIGGAGGAGGLPVPTHPAEYRFTYAGLPNLRNSWGGIGAPPRYPRHSAAGIGTANSDSNVAAARARGSQMHMQTHVREDGEWIGVASHGAGDLRLRYGMDMPALMRNMNPRLFAQMRQDVMTRRINSWFAGGPRNAVSDSAVQAEIQGHVVTASNARTRLDSQHPLRSVMTSTPSAPTAASTAAAGRVSTATRVPATHSHARQAAAGRRSTASLASTAPKAPAYETQASMVSSQRTTAGSQHSQEEYQQASGRGRTADRSAADATPSHSHLQRCSQLQHSEDMSCSAVSITTIGTMTHLLGRATAPHTANTSSADTGSQPAGGSERADGGSTVDGKTGRPHTDTANPSTINSNNNSNNSNSSSRRASGTSGASLEDEANGDQGDAQRNSVLSANLSSLGPQDPLLQHAYDYDHDAMQRDLVALMEVQQALDGQDAWQSPSSSATSSSASTVTSDENEAKEGGDGGHGDGDGDGKSSSRRGDALMSGCSHSRSRSRGRAPGDDKGGGSHDDMGDRRRGAQQGESGGESIDFVFSPAPESSHHSLFDYDERLRLLNSFGLGMGASVTDSTGDEWDASSSHQCATTVSQHTGSMWETSDALEEDGKWRPLGDYVGPGRFVGNEGEGEDEGDRGQQHVSSNNNNNNNGNRGEPDAYTNRGAVLVEREDGELGEVLTAGCDVSVSSSAASEDGGRVHVGQSHRGAVRSSDRPGDRNDASSGVRHQHWEGGDGRGQEYDDDYGYVQEDADLRGGDGETGGDDGDDEDDDLEYDYPDTRAWTSSFRGSRHEPGDERLLLEGMMAESQPDRSMAVRALDVLDYKTCLWNAKPVDQPPSYDHARARRAQGSFGQGSRPTSFL